jgi:knotted carbamoyltransferase YgeW
VTLDDGVLAPLLGRSVLRTPDLARPELDVIFALAERLQALDRAGVKTPLLEGELAYALFFDNSTRTRSAWAGAAARLGMHPVIVDGGSTQVSHGETAAETGAMLGMNAHALGVRHDLILGEGNAFLGEIKAGIDGYLAANGETRAVPVVNLQCDVDHPTQALADALWLRERFGASLAGKKVAVSWAYSPSYAKPLSVPQGLAMLLPRLGAEVVLAHPPGYELLDECLSSARAGADEGGGSFMTTDDMDAAFDGADVVYPKSWGPMALMRDRVEANRQGDDDALAALERTMLAQNAEHRSWICDEDRMAKTRGGDALYMHCLPADIGDEVSPGVMARAKDDVAREAQKKVYVIMALLAAAKVPNLASTLDALEAT